MKELVEFIVKNLVSDPDSVEIRVFIFVMVCCLVTVAVTAMLKVDPEYGKK